VAIIVLLASIVIPLIKLLGLFYLVVTTKAKTENQQWLRTHVHRVIEIIGPWEMLDVYLVAILVALVKLGRFATVSPGPGLLAFTSVVVLTVLASASFEPRLIWESNNSKE
jgi:paraquat-inducible protein A